MKMKMKKTILFLTIAISLFSPLKGEKKKLTFGIFSGYSFLTYAYERDEYKLKFPWRVSLTHYFSENFALQVERDSQLLHHRKDDYYEKESETNHYFSLLFLFGKGNFKPYLDAGFAIREFLFVCYPVIFLRGGGGLKYNLNPWPILT